MCGVGRPMKGHDGSADPTVRSTSPAAVKAGIDKNQRR